MMAIIFYWRRYTQEKKIQCLQNDTQMFLNQSSIVIIEDKNRWYICEGASKQFQDRKNSTAPVPGHLILKFLDPPLKLYVFDDDW